MKQKMILAVGSVAVLAFTSGCVEHRHVYVHRAPVVVSAPPPQVVVAQPPPVVMAPPPQVIVRPPPPPPAPVVVMQRPPAPPREVLVPSPGYQYVWRSGYWAWQDRWVWVRGAWVRPPRPHVGWVPGHWARHRHGGYIWIQGYWRVASRENVTR